MFLYRCGPPRAMTVSFWRFLNDTHRRNTFGRNPLDEGSARRLTTHNTHKSHISIPPAGFEPAIPASKRPQAYALDRAATGTANFHYYLFLFFLASTVQHVHKYSRTAQFWVFTQRVVIISYRRFGTTYLVPSLRVKNPKKFRFLTPEDRSDRLFPKRR